MYLYKQMEKSKPTERFCPVSGVYRVTSPLQMSPLSPACHSKLWNNKENKGIISFINSGIPLVLVTY